MKPHSLVRGEYSTLIPLQYGHGIYGLVETGVQLRLPLSRRVNYKKYLYMSINVKDLAAQSCTPEFADVAYSRPPWEVATRKSNDDQSEDSLCSIVCYTWSAGI